ncbi:MAG: glycosyltransferase family 4 protein [Bacteroidota bacterium]
MKVLFISRSTLLKEKGGDTIQLINTAYHLVQSGIEVDIHLTTDKINYEQYDLIHFFNITRPADIIYHINKTQKPFVVSPILVDYSEYDKYHRKGLAGIIFRHLPAPKIEYLKTISRWLKGKDKLRSLTYLWKGHQYSIKSVLKKTSLLLPNSEMEYEQLKKSFSTSLPYVKAPNGIDVNLFQPERSIEKDPLLVICVARIEGLKNQVNLIKALNNTPYQLLIIGASATNQLSYYNHCKKIAAKNISFIDQLPQEELIKYYQKAKVHVLPSWFETCGLSSLEAAAMGCNIVITNKGFASEYFEDMAYYCDPASPASILRSVEEAAASETKKELQEKIFQHYTWKQAALKTAEAYNKVIPA